MVNGSKHCSKLNDVTLPYLLIPVKAIQVEKVSLSDIKNLFVNPLTADDNYSLLNRGNLLHYFQMQISQKRKIFSLVFFAFSKFRFNF